MKRPIRSAALIFAIALGFGLVPLMGQASDPGSAITAPFEDGTVLAGFRAGVSDANAQAIEQEEGATRTAVIGAGAHVLRVGAGKVAAKIAALSRHREVSYAEPNHLLFADLIPNDPSFNQLWGLQNTGQSVLGTVGTPGADIKAVPAWNVTTGTRSAVVAVVDTGVDYNHPDLAANIWSAPAAFTVNIGGRAIICPVGSHGFNAITNVCDPLDDNNHGSHVSGTIGAVGNNALGVVGVNWTASIMGSKFLDASGSGTTAGAINAIEFTIQAKTALGLGTTDVRVLSNSWGGGGFSQALLDEINKANTNDMLFVAAAGNSAANNDVTPHYPSSYNAPNVVAVAATDQNDGLASFSNFGATSVHLGAPGTNILSTVIGGAYDYFNGTSMATPHVSGAAALILSKLTLTTAALKSQILNNVDSIPALAGITVTGGRLNVCKAIPGCGGPPPPPTPDFTLSATPSSQTVVQGASTSYTVTITPTGGFTGSVQFSVSGLAAGATGIFSPNPASTSSVLTVTTTPTAATGSFPLTITGTSGSLTRTTSVSLVVNPPGPPPPCDGECP